MSIPFSGSLSRSGGIFSAIKKQVRLSNLKAVKAIVASYDPWHPEYPHFSARQFMYHISSKEAIKHNPDCKFSTAVVNDRSEPKVTCNLTNGETVVIKTRNFTELEILQLFNKYVSPTGPPLPVPPRVKPSHDLRKRS